MKIKHGLHILLARVGSIVVYLGSLWTQQDGSVARKVNIPGFDSLHRLCFWYTGSMGHVRQVCAN